MSTSNALRHHERPEVFNSYQGSQFTSMAFADVLKREGVTISMDRRGQALDNIFVERLWRNVKYEDVYLKGYADAKEHHPERWTGATRNWNLENEVWLNLERSQPEEKLAA